MRGTGRTMQYGARRQGDRPALMQSGVLVMTPASLMCATWTSASGVAITSACEKRSVIVAGFGGSASSWSAWA